MNRIVTALSISALLGATAVGSLQAGGPPSGGYDPQPRAGSQTDTMRGERETGAAAGSMNSERSAASVETMSGTEAQAARDADGRPDTLFGYPVAYTYPFADGEEVRPERIGGVRNPETAGRIVEETTGRSSSVAELHELDAEE